MPLLAGDIRFARSANMADVPEGGGPPSAQLLTSGRSNEIFPDISEETRTVGRVEIYQIFSILRNSDRTPLLGGNVILAEPPADPNISITLLSLKNPFATRADIVRRIESGMSAGTEWNGYLLENHYETMRSITVLQRPGTAPPAIGRTYLMIYNEGLPTERRQRVRIKATDVQQRLFTDVSGSQPVDFLAQVTTCELFDGLMYDYPGSPPSRAFTRNSTKSMIRETVYSDSGMFYGASRLAQPTAINDVWLKVASIYTQVVPNSRTEVAAVDQYPSARQTVTLASAPREIKVGITPHTQRIRINEENAGVVYVALLKPAPAPGTVFIDFWVSGQRYTLTDDGNGKLVGQGSGSVNYLTGVLNITLKKLPDIGSSITITHGEKSAYTNRSGQAGYRAPEFSWGAPHAPFEPGSVVVTWMSGGVLKTATDNGHGGFTGDASGEIDYAGGKIYLRPKAMIDAGGEFHVDYRYTTTRTENFTNLTVDAGGFAAITLQEAPAPNSLVLDWATVRNVSASAGTSDFVSSNGSDQAAILETRTQAMFAPTPPTVVPPSDYSVPMYPATEVTAASATTAPGGSFAMTLVTHPDDGNGAFTWTINRVSGAAIGDAFEITTGTVQVAERKGVFDFKAKSTLTADFQFTVSVTKAGGPVLATSVNLLVDINESTPAPESLPTYTTTQIQGFYNRCIAPGEKRWAAFTGPVPAGVYLWDIVTQTAGAFENTSGSFTVSQGDGGFWVNTKDSAALNTTFTVRVKKQDGTVLAKCGEIKVLASPDQSALTPPPAAVKVRDPISMGTTTTTSGATSVAGMFAGGVDSAGKTVYVAVPPSTSEQWGAYYDPPASESEVWTSAQIAVRSKPLKSVNGLTTTYQIWGG